MFDIALEETEHKPNESIPIDVNASRFANNKGISFFLSGGDKYRSEEGLSNIFESGTLVHP